MSKYIVIVDIPDDYAEDYSQWKIEGELRYLEDGAWTHFKDVEAILKPNDKTIPVEWLEQMWKKDKDGFVDEYGVYHSSDNSLGESCKHVLENWNTNYKWKWEKENELDKVQ